MSNRVHYRIVPRNPRAHLFEVSLTLATPDPAGQIVSLPTWIPGSYMIREFARNIVWLKASADGHSVSVEKLDKATWRCDPCAGPLTLVYEVYAWDLSVRAVHLDTTHGFFNGSSVFLMAHGQENAPVEVGILPPPDDGPQPGRYSNWRVATSLPRASAPPYGFGSYRAANYDELIDHPVEIGAFTLATFAACGVPHDIAITGQHRADMERLSADLQTICEYQIRFFDPQGRAPMDRYVFLVMAIGEGYGGLEHRASTALICSRDDLPRTDSPRADDLPPCSGPQRSDKYRSFLGLASHEYFHTWHVKRIKPAAFLPYDLSRENYTRQLWAFEGITSYYNDLVLARTGLITPEQYLALLAETITKVLRGSGHSKQSIADSSFDAWIKYYRQDENAPNSVANYYAKGSLVALALDLTIRIETDDKKSLDDVMRALWQRYGSQGVGVPEGGVEKVAEEVAGISLQDFFAHAVHGTDALPLSQLLAQFGVDYHLRSAESEKDNGGKPPAKLDQLARAVLGVKISAGGEAKLSHVYDGGAAQAAGLSAGDTVLAIDGLKVSGADLDVRVASLPIGATVHVHAFRRDELMEFAVTLQAAPEDTCYLKLAETSAAAIRQRREAWFGGNY